MNNIEKTQKLKNIINHWIQSYNPTHFLTLRLPEHIESDNFESILFIANQPFIRISGIEESKVARFMLNNTIILSGTVENTNKVVEEIYDLSNTYKNDGKEFNNKAIELFIKYEIISEENIEYLREKGKIE